MIPLLLFFVFFQAHAPVDGQTERYITEVKPAVIVVGAHRVAGQLVDQRGLNGVTYEEPEEVAWLWQLAEPQPVLIKRIAAGLKSARSGRSFAPFLIQL